MGRAILVLSRLDQLHDILQLLVDANLVECEISILIPGSERDGMELPGLEPLFETGDDVVAALGGQRDQASVDDVVGMLLELGVPPGEARSYGRRLRKGAVLISVRCAAGETLARVREIARIGGAELIPEALD